MGLLIKKEKKRLRRTMGESPALLLIESNGKNKWRIKNKKCKQKKEGKEEEELEREARIGRGEESEEEIYEGW